MHLHIQTSVTSKEQFQSITERQLWAVCLVFLVIQMWIFCWIELINMVCQNPSEFLVLKSINKLTDKNPFSFVLTRQHNLGLPMLYKSFPLLCFYFTHEKLEDKDTGHLFCLCACSKSHANLRVPDCIMKLLSVGISNRYHSYECKYAMNAAGLKSSDNKTSK